MGKHSGYFMFYESSCQRGTTVIGKENFKLYKIDEYQGNGVYKMSLAYQVLSNYGEHYEGLPKRKTSMSVKIKQYPNTDDYRIGYEIFYGTEFKHHKTMSKHLKAKPQAFNELDRDYSFYTNSINKLEEKNNVVPTQSN